MINNNFNFHVFLIFSMILPVIFRMIQESERCVSSETISRLLKESTGLFHLYSVEITLPIFFKKIPY